jgi:hypothetical protein
MNYKPLTADEIYPLYSEPRSDSEMVEFARAVEAAVLARIAQAEPMVRICKYGDTTCPCPDGDSCHYEGKNPMTAPKPARTGPVSLHSAIMNLPLKPYDDNTTYYAYSRGHQDARHAAADLVDAHPQQADRELLERVLKALECASNGLLWYADMAPEHVGQSDGEVAEQIDSAITAIRLHLEKP